MTSVFDQDLAFLNETSSIWEESLKQELKLEDVKSKLVKKNKEFGTWPIISWQASPVQIPSSTSWKKASQTYLSYPSSLKTWIEEDLDQGVRCFFLAPNGRNTTIENCFESLIESKGLKDEVEVHYLENIIVGSEAHHQGGNSITELALTMVKLSDTMASADNLYVGAFMDSRFFHNIAKLRALKLMVLRFKEIYGIDKKVEIVALNSYRDWTLFDRHSNLLRNDIQVASGLIAGADHVQSTGFEAIFQLEDSSFQSSADSHRMARNTTHILSLESMLGMVEDAANGSYHLESLTKEMAEKSWLKMQQLLVMNSTERASAIKKESDENKNNLCLQFQTRKMVIPGINDFADPKEKISIQLKSATDFFRITRDWENLRLKVQSSREPWKAKIIVKGDTALLSARISFVKNYFESVGIEVVEGKHFEDLLGDFQILVLCSSDEEYMDWSPAYKEFKVKAKFVAGKVNIPGFDSIYMGQNVFEILRQLIEGSKQ